MAVTEEVPDLTPVSDSSASSGESLQSRETSRFHDVPVEVGDETRFRPLESRDEKHVSFGDCIVRKYPVSLYNNIVCPSNR